MSFMEFASRCSAITLISASAFGIAQAADPTLPRSAEPGVRAQAQDNAITTRVKAAFDANQISGIGIQTELGVVTLTGTVASEVVRQKAANIAAAVEGVRSVDIASLKVRRGT
jgi:osmotically-inducible protein OsmY